MPRVKKRTEQDQFRFRVDYQKLIQQTDSEKCWVVVMSDSTLNLALSLGRFIKWGTRWGNRYDEQGNSVPAPDYPLGTGPIDDLIHNYFWELNMACNASELTRIADATERIADNLQTPVAEETWGLAKLFFEFQDDMTLQDLIDKMEEADGPEYKFKDFLETLTFIKDLSPDFPSLKLPNMFEIYRNMKESRYWHTQNTLMAFQATALRGVQNALAPFDETEGDDEGTIMESIYNSLDQIPWERIAIAATGAIVEPTPVGEATLAAISVGNTLKSIKDWIKGKYYDWLDYYINQTENPIPPETVVGAILELKRGQINQPNLTLQTIINNISAVVGDNDITDFPDIYNILIQIADFLPDEFGEQYGIPDPSSFIMAAILDRSMNDLKEQLAEMADRIAPDALNNLADSVQNVDIAGIITQLTAIAGADPNSNLNSIIQQLIILSNRIAPADENIKSAIEALDLSVINDVDVNPVINVDPTPIDNTVNVNVDPTPIDNTVNVNLDVTALETALNLATAELVNLVTNTDNLTDLAELSNMVQKIEDLKCICENLEEMLKAQLLDGPDTQVVPIYSSVVDVYRCDAAKWLLGKIFIDLNYVIARITAVLPIPTDLIGIALEVARLVGLVAGILPGIAIAVAEVLLDALERLTINDLNLLANILQTNRPAFLCDIYTANNAEEAAEAIQARFYTLLEITEANELSEFIMTWIFTTGALDRVYLPDGHELRVTQEEIDAYTGWTNDDCTECGPILDLSCMPQSMLQAYGTPDLRNGGSVWDTTEFPIGAWHTLTSEFFSGAGSGNHQRINIIQFDDAYTMELEILSIPAGKELLITMSDCTEEFYNVTHDVIANLGTFQINELFIRTDPTEASDPGTFQIRIKRLN